MTDRAVLESGLKTMTRIRLFEDRVMREVAKALRGDGGQIELG